MTGSERTAAIRRVRLGEISFRRQLVLATQAVVFLTVLVLMVPAYVTTRGQVATAYRERLTALARAAALSVPAARVDSVAGVPGVSVPFVERVRGRASAQGRQGIRGRDALPRTEPRPSRYAGRGSGAVGVRGVARRSRAGPGGAGCRGRVKSLRVDDPPPSSRQPTDLRGSHRKPASAGRLRAVVAADSSAGGAESSRHSRSRPKPSPRRRTSCRSSRGFNRLGEIGRG
jgi:hypothetical protein